ncbi:beta-1,4-galactosyltransferase 2 isoform X1 [Daphnia magna]|uniref:beta-1,4-galactosyltransferase 2 isoform X1 n=1 Tax=Daphnia magna TaxID=35525 RepID=UPI001E1BA77A|nr:beta-1,4-galactosyltransferase 2 isoform X1 [Daphnia magna]
MATRRWLFQKQKLSVIYTLVLLSLLSSFASLVVFWYTFENYMISDLKPDHSLSIQLSNSNPSVSERSSKTSSHLRLIWTNGVIHDSHGGSTHGNSESVLKIQTKSRNHCPFRSPLLVGWLNISSILPGLLENNTEQSNLKIGGTYEPTNCQPREKVALIVPYRRRKEHLKIFLRYMHPFLQRQQLAYAVFVVEQFDSLPFNRGMLMNIGYKEAIKMDSFKCFIFHDVDLLPEDDRNLYKCPEDGKPRQMAFLMDIYDYKPAPNSYFGGVNAFLTTNFQLINGFSNLFWGWGSEDDDLYRRLLRHNLTVVRLSSPDSSLVQIARYTMLDHDWVNPNPDRDLLFKEWSYRQKYDGLSNLKYEVLKIEVTPLYTHILVDLRPKMPK